MPEAVGRTGADIRAPNLWKGDCTMGTKGNANASAKVSRRSFVGAAGVAAGTLACAAASASKVHGIAVAAPVADDGSYDSTADVIIVGAGGAGLAAGLVAARGGASVILIDAADVVGGNTAYSSGVIQAAGTDLQKESAGVDDDTPEAHAEFYIQAGEGQLDEDLVRTICSDAPDCVAFMQDLGVVYDTVYGNGVIPYVDEDVQKPRIHLASGSDADGNTYGAWHVAALKAACDEAGCEFVLGCEVTDLIQDDEGTVTGVVGADGTKFGANKGVILATCSFDRSEEMARAFSWHMVKALEDGRAITAATNTGGGIRMGMSVGAALTGFGGFIGLGNNVGGTPTLPGMPEVPGIIVNKYGRRFVSESDHYAWVLKMGFAQEDHIMWSVFDSQAAALGGPVVGGIQTLSDDLSTEIADGTVLTSDTIEGLAEQMDVPADNLQAAIDTWNDDMASTGTDSQFPTRSCGMVAIDQPPYYALRNYDFNLGAVGGLKVDPATQAVLNTDGDPIAHLYAAGQVVGGFMGSFYPGTGTGVLSTVSMGRRAGASVIA